MRLHASSIANYQYSAAESREILPDLDAVQQKLVATELTFSRDWVIMFSVRLKLFFRAGYLKNPDFVKGEYQNQLEL